MTRISNKISTSLIIAISIFLTYSCEKVIDLDLGAAEQMIVVNSVINPDSLIKVNLTRNRHILDNAEILPMEPPTYNPSVKLFINDEYTEDLSLAGNGNFISTIKPTFGSKYSIQVQEPTFTTVNATCKIPEPVNLLKVDTVSQIKENSDYDYYSYGGKLLECKITIDDPAEIENYYMLKFTVDKSYWQYRDTSYVVVDSAQVNGRWIYDFKDVIAYDKYARKIDDHVSYGSDDLAVQFMLGGRAVFSDALFNGEQYVFTASVPYGELYSLDSSIVHVNLMSLSEEYYRYLKTRNLHYESRDDYFATPVAVFNNIEDGAGIFGSYSVSSLKFFTKLIEPDEPTIEEGGDIHYDE